MTAAQEGGDRFTLRKTNKLKSEVKHVTKPVIDQRLLQNTNSILPSTFHVLEDYFLTLFKKCKHKYFFSFLQRIISLTVLK